MDVHRGRSIESCEKKGRIMPSRASWLRGVTGGRSGLSRCWRLWRARPSAKRRPLPRADGAGRPIRSRRSTTPSARPITAPRKRPSHGGGPVILMEGDNIVLRRGGKRLEVPYTPAVYHVLKAVAHVPLALDVILAPHAGEATLNDGGPGGAARVPAADARRPSPRSSARAWTRSSSTARGRSSPSAARSSIRSSRRGGARVRNVSRSRGG